MPSVQNHRRRLAGSEAAWQCGAARLDVELFEMRPMRSTPAHQTADFCGTGMFELTESDSENTASMAAEEEMRRAQSLLLEMARECAVRGACVWRWIG